MDKFYEWMYEKGYAEKRLVANLLDFAGVKILPVPQMYTGYLIEYLFFEKKSREVLEISTDFDRIEIFHKWLEESIMKLE